MNSLINKIVFIMLLMTITTISNAQFKTDPLVAGAVTSEAMILNSQHKMQNSTQIGILALNANITTQLDSIHKYERIVFNYLNEAQGVIRNAYEILRCADLGKSIFLNLKGCTEEMVNHPQQAVISVIVSKQYHNVFAEVSALTSYISTVVLKGGKNNLLSSAERQKMLWQVTGRLSSINRQVNSLRWQIAYLKWSYVPQKLVPKQYWTLQKSQVVLDQIKRDIALIKR